MLASWKLFIMVNPLAGNIIRSIVEIVSLRSLTFKIIVYRVRQNKLNIGLNNGYLFKIKCATIFFIAFHIQ